MPHMHAMKLLSSVTKANALLLHVLLYVQKNIDQFAERMGLRTAIVVCSMLLDVKQETLLSIFKTVLVLILVQVEPQLHVLLILEIGRAVQQECRDRSRMPSSA
eukprot:TRINITY_DN11402_c0_g1_i8.p2 TRINITY_DN11402_c0_g1~~TRINITY_DN11402_c0_g1_i8.p2  ORF type:complete len:104 (-),score=20.44 TRINITY_DN11402_c0_g1_i8:12-323(-)